MTVRRQGNADGGVALPITPMLDMSFQLLFFFIATFHLPTGMEGQMPLALHDPKSEPGPPATAPAGDVDLALRDDVTITLKGDGAAHDVDGVSALTLLSRSGDTSLPYSKDLRELRESLADMAATGAPAPSIKVQGGARVKWRGVVKVMDACREVGFQDVSFAAPPDDGGR